ncbi:MAG TPA: TonB family protein [Caulobacteraceae bacterium]|jgi:TonB family protein|nr:TonB family protein [Caulobacteraceae bacterium]
MRVAGWVALAAGLALGSFAHGADLSDPVWAQAPDRTDWAKAYPAHAAQAGISGDVKLHCTATAVGGLSGCAVISESPSAQGFGAAALSLTAGMQLQPTSADGRSISGRDIIVPVRFEPALLHPGPIVGNPDWLRQPSVNELVQYFPADARGATGKVLVQCVVTDRGAVEKCAVNKETPTGHGFGAAALAMTQLFQMRPMTLDGLPVGGGQVLIPIGFEGNNGVGGDNTPSMMSLRLLSNAPFTAVPTLAAMSSAFPRGAIGKAPSGHVVLRCGLRKDGTLSGCDPIADDPAGRGFDSAALALSKTFRVWILPEWGNISSLRVDIPFDFRDPGQQAPPLEIYDPIWLQSYNPQALAALFPQAAVKAGILDGRATVVCSVVHDGSLNDCSVTSETPAGLGFGSAALQIAAVMKMNPWTRQGAPVEGGRIRLPIHLVLPPAAAPAAGPANAPTPPKP